MEASTIYTPMCKILVHARWGGVSNHHQWDVQNSRPLNPSGNQLEGKCLASPQHHHSYFSKDTASSFHNSFETNKLTPNWKQWNSILACYSKAWGDLVFILQSSRQRNIKKKILEKIHQQAFLCLFCVIILVWRGIQKRRKIWFLFLSIWQSS